MSGRDGPVRVGDLVGSVLEARGVRKQVERQDVLRDWDEVVGEGIARVTRPRSLSEGTLFVEVRSSPWLMELEMRKGEILRRLNEGRPDAALERLVFVLAEDPDRDFRRTPRDG